MGDKIALLVLILVLLAAVSNHTRQGTRAPDRFVEMGSPCPLLDGHCTRVVQDLSDGSCWGMSELVMFGPVPCDGL